MLSHWDLMGYGSEALGGYELRAFGNWGYRLEPLGRRGRGSEVFGSTGLEFGGPWGQGLSAFRTSGGTGLSLWELGGARV